MKHLVRDWLLVGVLGLASVASQAQDARVGYVSQDRLLKEANSAKLAQAKLEQEFSKREKDLIELGNTLKTAGDKFERDSPTMTEAQRNTKQKQLLDQDREFQRKRREFQEDLSSRRNEELQQVLERANKVVKQVAESEKYDMILQEAVYVNPKHDITDRVLKAMNATK
mgnify:CR=1 FL=1